MKNVSWKALSSFFEQTKKCAGNGNGSASVNEGSRLKNSIPWETIFHVVDFVGYRVEDST